jgi:hypothetical protein
VLGEQAQEEPAVAVGPVHHRGDGKSARHNLLIHRCFFLA